jgi:hypothetical protein
MRLSPEMSFISDVLTLSLKPTQFNIEVNFLPVMDHINWEGFMPLVIYHGVGRLMFYWLRKLKLNSFLPRDVYRSFHNIYQSLSNIAEDHQEVIKRILKRFYESEIEVTLLKGAQLSRMDYPHFSLRPMEDIDLLVKRSSQSSVIKLMLEMGFNLYETSQTCDKFFIRQTSEGRKKKIHKPIFIEVHSNLQVPIRLNRSFSVDIDEFWNGTQMKTTAGFRFLELCPTHNLIYLCTHLSEHHFSRLIWAYDIALLIHRHREEIDWEKLGDLCGRFKTRSPLYHSLSLCQELFQISIPKKVLKRLSPSWGRRKMGEFLIRRNLLFPQSRIIRFNQFLIKALSIDNWMEAILWFLFPTRDWIRQQYSVQGIHEIYPYYLLHPILYLIKAIRPPMR